MTNVSVNTNLTYKICRKKFPFSASVDLVCSHGDCEDDTDRILS